MTPYADRALRPLRRHRRADVVARTGNAAQQGTVPVARDRRDNLFTPVHGDPGAHGRFDAIAWPTSFAAWLAMHQPQAAVAFAAGVTLALALRRRADGH